MNDSAHAMNNSRSLLKYDGKTEHMTLGELFDRAIASEELALHVYLEFARMFSHYPEICELWKKMADDEKTHHDLLHQAKGSLSPERLGSPAEPDIIGRMILLERSKIKMGIDGIANMNDAYTMAHDFEYCELNNIFQFLIAIDPLQTENESAVQMIRNHMTTLHDLGRYSKAELFAEQPPTNGAFISDSPRKGS